VCGGADCDLPSAYVITPSDDQLFCTKEEQIFYDIGCAGGSSNYSTCILDDSYLYDGLSGSGEAFTNDLIFRADGEIITRTMTCTSATPQTDEDRSVGHCTVSLPTGRELAFRTGDEPIDGIYPYQTIYDIVPRDIDAPMATINASDTSLESAGYKTLSSTVWRNTPLTTTITCQNSPTEDNDSCTCAWLVKADMFDTTENTEWNLSTPLADIVSYQRIIRNETILDQSFYVYDNAGNNDDTKSKVTINL